jgi:hypothetical protein
LEVDAGLIVKEAWKGKHEYRLDDELEYFEDFRCYYDVCETMIRHDEEVIEA